MSIQWQEPGFCAPTGKRRIHNVKTQDFLRALDEPLEVMTHFVRELGCSRPCFGDICPYDLTIPKTKIAYIAAELYQPTGPVRWVEVVWAVPELSIPQLGLDIRGVLFDVKRKAPPAKGLAIQRDGREVTAPMPSLEAYNREHVRQRMIEHWLKPTSHRPPDLLPWEKIPAQAPVEPGREQPTLLDFAATASDPVPPPPPVAEQPKPRSLSEYYSRNRPSNES